MFAGTAVVVFLSAVALLNERSAQPLGSPLLQRRGAMARKRGREEPPAAAKAPRREAAPQPAHDFWFL